MDELHLNLSSLRVLVLDDGDADGDLVKDGKRNSLGGSGDARSGSRWRKGHRVLLRVESVLILLESDEAFESKPEQERHQQKGDIN
jgi:hypothetical protein